MANAANKKVSPRNLGTTGLLTKKEGHVDLKLQEQTLREVRYKQLQKAEQEL